MSAAEFAAALDPLGPFERRPVLAVAVSGGADSLATAILTRDWVRGRGGSVVGLVVDHGLRGESGDEAAITRQRLTGLGIESVLLVLDDLRRGPGIAARARDARHRALEAACRERGIVHLVFGHHAGDQAETLDMRGLSGSGASGLAGMAALVEGRDVRKLRPLLATPPGRLRALLRDCGVAWVEDPSNTDMTQLRARLRAARGDPDGTGADVAAALRTAQRRGAERAVRDWRAAGALAGCVEVHPQGCALVRGASLPSDALAGLLGMLGGALYPPSPRRVARLAGALSACTIAGVRVLPAGRLGPGWLLVREEQAMAAPVEARAGAVWDGRYRLVGDFPEGAMLGAWGEDAPRDRRMLPGVVLRTLPVVRRDGEIVAVGPGPLILHAPRHVACGAPFVGCGFADESTAR